MVIMIVNTTHAQTAKFIRMTKHFGTHFTSWLSSGSQNLIKTSMCTMGKRECFQILFSVTRNVRGILVDHFKDRGIGFRNKTDRSSTGCCSSRHMATTSVTESCLVERKPLSSALSGFDHLRGDRVGKRVIAFFNPGKGTSFVNFFQTVFPLRHVNSNRCEDSILAEKLCKDFLVDGVGISYVLVGIWCSLLVDMSSS
ncbi:hypothetical protein K501DRAFT_269105 [Backusella circina FSU 941]|nr:hypothetical protein K501DRAFT_269105 [Backusella circina FSU 941]